MMTGFLFLDELYFKRTEQKENEKSRQETRDERKARNNFAPNARAWKKPQ